MKRLAAKLFLAFHLVKHLLRQVRYLFTPRESQLEPFKKNYLLDRPLWIPTPEERKNFSSFSKCINCGVCELDCAMLIEKPGLEFKPSWIALACTRYSPDYHLVAKIADVCGQCAGCTVQCPTEVPIREMSRFVLEKVEAWKREKQL